LIGDDKWAVDAQTQRKLAEELERHKAPTDKATDYTQMLVICQSYMRRLSELLRLSERALD
jgi:hypothetical protein